MVYGRLKNFAKKSHFFFWFSSSSKMSTGMVLAIGALILFYRKPDSFLVPQLWAEDGVIFLAEGLKFGISSLWTPYAGYFLFFPRTIALLAQIAPPLFAPTFYNYACLLTTLAVMVYILSGRIPLKNKPLFALSLILVPHSGEVFLNLTNIQWIFALSGILLLISNDPKSRKAMLFDFMILGVYSFTGPFHFFLFPFWIFRWMSRKTRHSLILLGASAFFIAIQVFMTSGVRSVPNFSNDIEAWIHLFGHWSIGSLFLGQNISNLVDGTLLSLLGVLFLGYLSYLIVSQRQACACQFLVLACLLSAAAIIRIPHDPISLAKTDRYTYLPRILLIWSMLIVLDPPKFRILRQGAILLVLLSSVSHFQAEPLARFGWKKESQSIQGRKILKAIPINPPGWWIPASN